MWTLMLVCINAFLFNYHMLLESLLNLFANVKFMDCWTAASLPCFALSLFFNWCHGFFHWCLKLNFLLLVFISICFELSLEHANIISDIFVLNSFLLDFRMLFIYVGVSPSCQLVWETAAAMQRIHLNYFSLQFSKKKVCHMLMQFGLEQLKLLVPFNLFCLNSFCHVLDCNWI